MAIVPSTTIEPRTILGIQVAVPDELISVSPAIVASVSAGPPEMEAAAKTEEAWLRVKERLKGDPIDWSKTIDLQYLNRAMAMK